MYVENEDHNIEIALIPKKHADKLAELLEELYGAESDGGVE